MARPPGDLRSRHRGLRRADGHRAGREARRATYRALEDAFAAAQVEPGERHIEDRGDGVLVLVSGSISKTTLLDRFPAHLADRLDD
ncbi:hypothetical protein [Actinomadura sp. 9N215]|uniref:hypothetical protein n=1 Tax=Actinomadura sp. 9N215 TaxID=3375150 RepID=UPI0037BFE9E2